MVNIRERFVAELKFELTTPASAVRGAADYICTMLRPSTIVVYINLDLYSFQYGITFSMCIS